ncbi:uncharacterized protein YjbI with pentapeptide repeats [Enterococcus sp. PF1-24]|uniref:pentapeptide repeat-containing protein n=1 Tax=unclassified Enterococcus TaxID=2608891 RepID=UPI0024745303|nr:MULTISPECIES: pentapeptide repeat-containing protein [unclassified Enterococcus]MDH6363407.1 uncharacterized protein YjbI with pentapeptide repeats [Enterococcus sp. PFB1-1]MDH6400501.1 uncharacterized protein YjbI with pentapeptide repeats [Enterococcus sp. PF1-24]
MKKVTPISPILPKLTENFLDVEEEMLFDGNLFFQQDVSYASGSNIIFRGCQLDHVTLRNSRFERFECSNVVFDHCDLSNAEWLAASFHQVVFKNCKLIGTNFAESYLRDCQFIDCLGEFTSFSHGNLKVVTFENCQLSRSEFFEVDWKNLLLKNCNLDDSSWFHTKLQGLDFRSNHFQWIALSLELLRGLQVNQEQAIVIATGLGLVIED